MGEATFKASDTPDLRNAHVIVAGAAMDKTGKSMLAILISVALLRGGFKVATVDLDRSNRTMTRFFENRQALAASPPWEIEQPFHQSLDPEPFDRALDEEAREFSAFAEALSKIEQDYEFIVIDTCGTDCALTRLAHSLADTLVSPFDIPLGSAGDPGQNTRVEAYIGLVQRARQKRKAVDWGVIDWIVIGTIPTKTNGLGHENPVSLHKLQARAIAGSSGKNVFSELFPLGLTVLDPIEDMMDARTLQPAQLSARREIETFMETLQLPERGKEHGYVDARAMWFTRVSDYYRDLGQKS
jgi:chromosome partitioning protein